jgi:hypothetical protein
MWKTAMGKQLKLLPEDQWLKCKKCTGPVPEFAGMPDDLRRELEALLKTSAMGTISRLLQLGCTFATAQAWTVHYYAKHHQEQEPCITMCPHCGKPLRTPSAKQCRFCGADWH